jgi:hypothetical protein
MTNPTSKNPLFQHRHFVEIARIISHINIPPDLRREVILGFTHYLLSSNDNFDVDRFEAACCGKPINWRDSTW